MTEVPMVSMRDREYNNFVEALEQLDDIAFNDEDRSIPGVFEDKAL